MTDPSSPYYIGDLATLCAGELYSVMPTIDSTRVIKCEDRVIKAFHSQSLRDNCLGAAKVASDLVPKILDYGTISEWHYYVEELYEGEEIRCHEEIDDNLKEEVLQVVERMRRQTFDMVGNFDKAGNTVKPFDSYIRFAMNGQEYDTLASATEFNRKRIDGTRAICNSGDNCPLLDMYPGMDGGQPIVLSHNNLVRENMMVKNGHLVGLIDWKEAGAFPTAYEYGRCCIAGSDTFLISFLAESLPEQSGNQEVMLSCMLCDLFNHSRILN